MTSTLGVQIARKLAATGQRKRMLKGSAAVPRDRRLLGCFAPWEAVTDLLLLARAA